MYILITTTRDGIENTIFLKREDAVKAYYDIVSNPADIYHEKVTLGKTNDGDMFSLLWENTEFEDLDIIFQETIREVEPFVNDLSYYLKK